MTCFQRFISLILKFFNFCWFKMLVKMKMMVLQARAMRRKRRRKRGRRRMKGMKKEMKRRRRTTTNQSLLKTHDPENASKKLLV